MRLFQGKLVIHLFKNGFDIYISFFIGITRIHDIFKLFPVVKLQFLVIDPIFQ